jgi:hypothetical protein
MQTFYLVLADAILVLHALVILFNLGALPVIWLGHFRKWRFVRNFSFRMTHLALIGYVTAESLWGVNCPLTKWEDMWRSRAGVEGRYQGGFIAHWLHRLIFYDLDEKVFAVGYGIFFALVLFTLFRVKPRPPKWWTRRRKPQGP